MKLQIELIEARLPVVITDYGFVPDSGGAGRVFNVFAISNVRLTSTPAVP